MEVSSKKNVLNLSDLFATYYKGDLTQEFFLTVLVQFFSARAQFQDLKPDFLIGF